MPDEAPQREVLLTTAQAGNLLEITGERVRQLAAAGFIEKRGRDQVPLVSAVRGYIRFLKDEERKANKTATANRVQDARAREIEQRIAERDARLIDIVEHQDLFSETYGIVKAGLAGVPARVTRDVDLRKKIEMEIDDVLRQAADRFEEGTADLRAGRSAAAPVSEDDAG